jgi:diguanylate cyclase (GGDEF)-like protein
MTDWLTGLLNKGAFRTSSLRELRRAQRYRQHISLLLFDIDDFKEINDGFGHDKGDAVLRETSRILRRSVRDVDICARYGGDEFAVLLPETARGGAAAVARRIAHAMSQEFSVPDGKGGKLDVAFSGGLSVYPEDGEDLGELLRRADSALYQAKGEGKNRIVTDFVERRLAKRYDLAARNLTLTLRRAAGRGTLVAKLKNVSRTGFGLTADQDLEVGESVEISLERPERRMKRGMLGRVVRHGPSPGTSGSPGFFLAVDLEEGSRSAAESTIEAFAIPTGGDDPGEGRR